MNIQISSQYNEELSMNVCGKVESIAQASGSDLMTGTSTLF